MRLSCNSSAASRTKKNTRSLSSRCCALFAVFIRERDAVQLPAVMPRREGRRAWKTQQPADSPSPAPSITIPDFKPFVPPCWPSFAKPTVWSCWLACRSGPVPRGRRRWAEGSGCKSLQHRTRGRNQQHSFVAVYMLVLRYGLFSSPYSLSAKHAHLRRTSGHWRCRF